ncbi:hypothetical protein Lal_00018399 [Lupinus albus]|nr:hypothetical protein Lal_00018399 [Lupinus albus]
MAPSSRSKRARNTNPLDLSCLLKDDDQQKRFLNHYIEKPVMTPKYGSLAAFEEYGCHFPSLIRAQGLHVFVEDKTPFYIELIRVFYCNLKLENEALYSYVKGKHIALTLTEFGECLSLPSTGAMLGSFIECPWSGFNKREFYFSLRRFSEAEISRKRSRSAAGSSRETLGVGNLTVENRLLHYFLEYIIFQKGSNYSRVNDFELQLLYGILNMESINWSFVIFQLMINQTAKSGPLPYAFAITRILQKFNVDFTIELKTPFSIKEHRIDLTSLGKMQIVEAPDGSLRHKDQQVEDDAPLEAPAQPAPLAPQDLGNSPDYQSIMDELAGQRAELINMRAYMTTRMDHIDSRLDSMDSRFDEITSLLRNL